MKNILTVAIIAGLGWYGYTKYQDASQRSAMESLSDSNEVSESRSETGSPSLFTCDGRTYCSQMTSCAEATYFIQHCPNTKMDGNNDGVPCEKQWCK
jgi:hypothetical protein